MKIPRSILPFLLVAQLPILANSAEKLSSSLDFMNMGLGARPMAMGGSFVGLSNDLNAIQWNPAGLGKLNAVGIDTHYASLYDDMKYTGITIAVPSRYKTTLGLSYSSLDSGNIPKTTASNRGLLLTEDGSFVVKDNLITASIANASFRYLHFGGSYKYAKETIDAYSASASLFDFGMISNISSQLRLGLVMQNNGGSVKFVDENSKVASSLSGGIALRPKRNVIFTADTKKPKGQKTEFSYGVEITIGKNVGANWIKKSVDEAPEPEISPLLALRAGYRSAGSEGDYASPLSFGVGFFLKKIHLDYAFVDFGDLGPTHQFSIGYSFGQNPYMNLADWGRKDTPTNLWGEDMIQPKETQEKKDWIKNRKKNSSGKYRLE